ncbi:MAG: hypothetical protein KME16_20245 [Scytolyngbya sp. HA4215-MV1]|jgi:hypothetical protein|nr:hypothetical protein [Scytolyngbya sp. HA4215-MV1]
MDESEHDELNLRSEASRNFNVLSKEILSGGDLKKVSSLWKMGYGGLKKIVQFPKDLCSISLVVCNILLCAICWKAFALFLEGSLDILGNTSQNFWRFGRIFPEKSLIDRRRE